MITIKRVGDQKQYKLSVRANGWLSCDCPEQKPCSHMREFSKGGKMTERIEIVSRERPTEGKEVSGPGSAMLQEFNRHFRNWVRAACEDWGYAMPPETYFAKVYERLPEGLRALLGLGLKSGLIISKGRTFTLRGLPSEKGPYNWFSHYTGAKEPAPNCEYFVHVAEFIRLHTIAAAKRLSVTFEDDTMDIALYQDNRLLIYCEVKEKVSQIQKLIKGIKAYQPGVDFAAPDRGNDPLCKAKCIVRRKPEYFVGVAIGARFEYKVIYPEDNGFQLIRDVVPLI